MTPPGRSTSDIGTDDLRFSRRRLLQGAAGAATLPLLPTVHGANGELPSGAQLWKWVRAQQMLSPRLCYLDTATVGPSWRSVLAGEYRAEDAFNSDPETFNRAQRSAWRASLEHLGRWLDCSADELCPTTGASEALALVVKGLDLSPGDEVVTTTHEHAAALEPWLMRAQRQGIVIKQVPLPMPLTGPEQALGLLAGAVTERTRVLAFCHVQPTDGAVLPVRELCAFARQRNILSVVDGALAPGALQFSVREFDCDFYAASLHKWVNGPYGTGLLYVHPARLQELWAAGTGVAGERGADDWPLTLARLGGSYRYFAPRWQALDAALLLQEQIGRGRIEARLRELAIYTKLRLQQLANVEILTPAHPALWGAVMSIRVGVDASVLAERLAREHGVVVGAVRRDGLDAVRVSLHIYNSHDDIERLLQALQQRLRA